MTFISSLSIASDSFFESDHFSESHSEQEVLYEEPNEECVFEEEIQVIDCHGCDSSGWIAINSQIGLCPICNGHGKLYINDQGIVHSYMPIVRMVYGGESNGES